MASGGLGWLTLLSPSLARSLYPYNLAPGLFGEGSLTLWLLVIGVNAQRWKEQAALRRIGSRAKQGWGRRAAVWPRSPCGKSGARRPAGSVPSACRRPRPHKGRRPPPPSTVLKNSRSTHHSAHPAGRLVASRAGPPPWRVAAARSEPRRPEPRGPGGWLGAARRTGRSDEPHTERDHASGKKGRTHVGKINQCVGLRGLGREHR